MKFCMKCMAQYDDSLKTCPECGQEEGLMPENARCMEPGLVLADRYIVGLPLNIDGWFVKYIGWDALTCKKVTIYEYSPVRFSERSIGETKITAIKEKEFYRYMDSLQKKAQLLAEQHLPPNIGAVYESFEKNGTAYIIAEYVKGEPLAEHIKANGAFSPQDTEALFLPLLRSIDTLHEIGFVIGGFSVFDLLILEDQTLFLNSYLENMLFNVTDDPTDINQTEKQKFFPPERLRAADSPELLPANDVFSAAMVMHLMMGVTLPDPDVRRTYYEKNRKDKLKRLGSYHIRLSPDKEAAMRNASFISTEFRTPDMESFIKELSGEKKVLLRTKKKGMPLWAKIMIPAACVLLAASGVTLALMLRSKDKPAVVSTLQQDTTVVPDVTRMKLSDAEQLLTQSELLIEIMGRQTDDTLEPDTVLSQNPAEGSLTARNTVIGVVVSVRNWNITMPNFIGLDGNACMEQASGLGLQCTLKQEYSNSVAEGCVISQSIKPYEEVRTDMPLELTVSMGRDPDSQIEDHETTVESHIGQSYEQFLSEAAQSGTPVKVVGRVHDSSKPEGTIVNQYPPADTVQSTADVVQIEVTTAVSDVIVPNVCLLDQSKAVSVLAIYDLEAVFQEDYTDCAAGLVASQQPDAGAHAEPGAQITLTVSKGKKQVTVPELTGRPYADAVSMLTESGLSPRVEYASDPSRPAGEVISQSMAAGTEVSKGTAVLMTVNSEQTLAEIPDVQGMTSEEAKKAIESAGFHMAVYISDQFQAKSGTVFAQVPYGGTHAEKGASVTVLLVEKDRMPADGDTLSSMYDIPDDLHDYTVTPESISLMPDEEFELRVEWEEPEYASEISYEFSEEGILQEIETDQENHILKFRALKPGTAVITLSSGNVQKICFVEVQGEDEIKGTVLMTE